MNDSRRITNQPLAITAPARRQPFSANTYSARSASGNTSPDTMSDSWNAIRRARFILPGCMIGGLLLAVVISGLQTPLYQATTVLELPDPAHNVSPFAQATATSDAASDSDVVTQVSLLQNDALIRRVVRELNLARRPEFAHSSDSTQLLWRLFRRQKLSPETPVDRAVQAADRNLSIRHAARVIDVTYTSDDPALAAGFVNALANEDIQEASASDTEAVRQLRQWLDRETTDLGRQLAQAEDEMQHYAEAGGLVRTDSNDTAAEGQLRLLGQQLGQAEADRIVKQTSNAVVAAAPADATALMSDDPLLKDYETELTDLRRQSQGLQSMYTPDSYKVKQLENQISVLRAAIQTELTDLRRRSQNEYQAARDREDMLKARFNSESQQVSDQDAKLIHYATLQQELGAMRTMHAELLEKSQQLGIAAAAPKSDLRVVSAALPPARPFTPNYPLNLSLGLFAGLFAGVITAVSRERVRPMLRAPGDSSQLLRLPEFAAIPRICRSRDTEQLAGPKSVPRLENRLELAAWNGTSAPLIESIHDALASITASCDRGSRIILFTSPCPGEGKTTITANLAISLALCGRRVLLIDGDLRRPRLHRIFNVAVEPGLADALRDVSPETKSDAAGIRVNALPIPDFYLMTSGKPAAMHAPLFGAKRLGQVLAQMRNQYDVILIDAPPVLHGPDARLLARFADSVILITRARKTTHQDAVAAACRLAADNIPLAGTILNDWNPQSDNSAYSTYSSPEPEVETSSK